MTSDQQQHYCRRRIARPQLELLVQYMERYPALALAHARSREGHSRRKRMWDKISRTLNRVDQDQARSGYSWHRYWLDLKFKIRRKYSVIQKCHASGAPCSVQLSALEERLVKILTDDKGNLFPTGSAYLQVLQCPLKGEAADKLTPISKRESQLDYFVDVHETADDDFAADVSHDRLSERLLPTSSDVKPNVSRLRDLADVDPIQTEREVIQPLQELRRELLEFELSRQKELFEIEKRHKIERHEMEMSILKIRKQMMTRELSKL